MLHSHMTMKPIELSKDETRNFLIRSHLMDGPKLKPGVASMRKLLKRFQVVQVDSIDVCGTSQEIALASRIENFSPEHLSEFLYGKKHEGFEYWSKCLSILPRESKPFYEYRMKVKRVEHKAFFKEHRKTVKHILDEIKKTGPMTSTDFSDNRRVSSWWMGTDRLARRMLECLWDVGDVMISHRKRRIRYFDLAERIIPWSGNDVTESDFRKKMLLDRLNAMRLMRTTKTTSESWDRLNISWKEYQNYFLDDGIIQQVTIEGLKGEYLILKEDKKYLGRGVKSEKYVRLLAPLDSFLWDSKPIRHIFDFEPKFEIYHPPVKRRWGYYSLPILYGFDLVGRTDLARDKKKDHLEVKSVHWEKGFKPDDEFLLKFADALNDHARFTITNGVNITAQKFPGSGKLKKLVK